MSSVFDLPANFKMDHFPHYGRFITLFKKRYGVTDPHRYYRRLRQRLLDRALPDPFGITRYATLDDWWQAQALNYRYGNPHTENT